MNADATDYKPVPQHNGCCTICVGVINNTAEQLRTHIQDETSDLQYMKGKLDTLLRLVVSVIIGGGAIIMARIAALLMGQ